MANPPSLFFFTTLLVFLSLSLASSPHKSPPPHCHDDEASALLQFGQSLAINVCASPFDAPKLESWKMVGQRSNCCSWAGVECDNTTGHVISLDLSNSCLYGALNFNTTLSKLSRLEHINLAYNNFRHSLIPSMSDLFPQLTYLNLSYSLLSGFVPPSISQLSKLSTLSLTGEGGLALEGHTFEALVENLTRLELLQLKYVDISSTIPKMMVNLSSLRFIDLSSCGLNGPFPQKLFNLNNLKLVDLSYNGGLVGFLPQFNSTSPLEYLELDDTGFSGSIPVSIGNLHSLEWLTLSKCSFSGQLPTSLQNLTQLSALDISYNKFEETDPSSLSWLGERTKLIALGLGSISLPGEIPGYLANLTRLRFISLQSCHLRGPLPSWLFEMSKLQTMDFAYNKLQGTIPNLFPQLTELSYLDLASNNLSGKVDLNMFLDLESLTSLFLSENNFSLVQSGDRNVTADRFLQLDLGSCNLHQFPYFLHNQNQLTWLILSYNSIRGQIPQWMWNVSRDTLQMVDLSYNFLTGFESDPGVIPWSRATWVQLNNNMFHGPLPLPSTSTVDFLMDDNEFTGEISPIFCTFTSLLTLDLSYNNLSGEVPGCLANFTTSLETLALGGNNLHGNIPQPSSKDCNLKVFAIESNEFDGTVPRSLANCQSLQFLNLANNKIQDTFPSWLGPLEQLGVLILRSNNLYGRLESKKTSNPFPKISIIDISSNSLSGPLPTQYFMGWNAMKIKGDNGTYLKSSDSGGGWDSYYLLYMSLTNKGISTTYSSIEESFVVIDFSGNKFHGNIPSVIGSLSGLHLLNLSNNILTGKIPSSLANLSDLEALDLSGNSLSGEIPSELARLTFLSFFNVSNNNLTGTIPHGNQFDIFQNDSYWGNPTLCGNPLSKQCGDPPRPPPSTSKDNDDDDGSLFDFGWKPVAVGYGCGFPFGIGLGYLVYIWKYIWIVKIFGEKRMRRRKVVRGVGQWDKNRVGASRIFTELGLLLS